MSNSIIVITKGRQHHEVIGCQFGIRKKIENEKNNKTLLIVE